MSCLIRLALLGLILTVLTITPVNIPAVQKIARAGRSSSSIIASDTQKRIKAFQRRPSSKALAWADSQLRRMSLKEKIGQLISVGINGRFFNQDSEYFRELRRQVEKNHIGGIVLYRGTVYESVHLTNRMQHLARYPLLISADMEYGAGMRFEDTVNLPWNMAVGATGNPNYAQRQGEIIAHEARALGIRQVFGPVVDVNNNAANPIINVRAYSEDPLKVAKFSEAFINGAQSNGVIATAKHFPGHGDTVIDSHRGLPVINAARARLDRIELVPFRATINAGVGSVMVAYIGLPQIDPTIVKPLPPDKATRPSYVAEGEEIVTEGATLPAALSPVVVEGLLRRELDFDGLIVTDALDMSGLTIYFNQDDAAVRALDAGVDMLIKPSDPDAAVRGLLRAVETKRISEKRIEESTRRILAVKYDLGLVQMRYVPMEQIDHRLSDSEVVAFAREVAEHAITLVRNDGNLVPARLRQNAKIFNLAITNGDDRLIIAEPFVAEMERNGWRMKTIVLDGRSSKEEIDEVLKRAQDADLVIASLYGRVRAGEARSGNLPEPATRALNELIDRNIPIIGISFGNPYLLQSFPRLRTYLIAYGDMPCLQEATVRAILGKIDITGKLPITLPNLYQRDTGIQLKANVELAK
ncbi:MAG TPA: glycoside hydrolase family 3 N-terminal domain-containing protein [Pyrinomonadaceae bacterium]|nr:glycoside hydrolase family 3 N-terminal domain-containing protein [Pyrinomonadaceae bacterium]